MRNKSFGLNSVPLESKSRNELYTYAHTHFCIFYCNLHMKTCFWWWIVSKIIINAHCDLLRWLNLIYYSSSSLHRDCTEIVCVQYSIFFFSIFVSVVGCLNCFQFTDIEISKDNKYFWMWILLNEENFELLA